MRRRPGPFGFQGFGFVGFREYEALGFGFRGYDEALGYRVCGLWGSGSMRVGFWDSSRDSCKG